MIEFSCQYCDNHMRAEPRWAGRDACCGKCHRFIIIPEQNHGVVDVATLNPKDRILRQEKLIRHLSNKLRACKKFMAAFQNKEGHYSSPESWLSQKVVEKMQEHRSKVAALVDHYEAEISTWQQRTAEHETQLAAYETKCSDFIAAQQEYNKKIDVLTLRNSQLEDKLKQLNEQLDQRMSQVEDARDEKSALTSCLDLLTQEQKAVQDRLTESETLLLKAQDGRDHYKGLFMEERKARSDAEIMLFSLKRDREKLETLLSENEKTEQALQEEISRYRQLLEDEGTARYKAECQVADLQQERTALREELTEKEAQDPVSPGEGQAGTVPQQPFCEAIEALNQALTILPQQGAENEHWQEALQECETLLEAVRTDNTDRDLPESVAALSSTLLRLVCLLKEVPPQKQPDTPVDLMTNPLENTGEEQPETIVPELVTLLEEDENDLMADAYLEFLKPVEEQPHN